MFPSRQVNTPKAETSSSAIPSLNGVSQKKTKQYSLTRHSRPIPPVSGRLKAINQEGLNHLMINNSSAIILKVSTGTKSHQHHNYPPILFKRLRKNTLMPTKRLPVKGCFKNI